MVTLISGARGSAPRTNKTGALTQMNEEVSKPELFLRTLNPRYRVDITYAGSWSV